MAYKYEYILVRFGELSTKGKNKKDFIKRLLVNIKHALYSFENLKYERTNDRLYITLNDEPVDEISPILARVFGIRSFSLAMKVPTDIEEIKKAALVAATYEQARELVTFKVDTRRNYKQFPFVSDEINRAVAGLVLSNTDLKVDVHNPDFRLMVEIREHFTYIMSRTVLGAGGFPVGVGGKALLMLSGGIDSPVAGYLTMKRGVEIECIHYASPPYTSSQAQDKVLLLAKQLSAYQGRVKLHIIPFTDLQLAIYQNCPESYAITIMRRMMYRLADKLCENSKCTAIVNGECIGQVASQTLESMQTINEVTSRPIIRPVITYDKLEIINLAKTIETYETSILPFEDCCTIFTPKNPVIKPTIEKANKLESRFEFAELIEHAITNTTTIVLRSRELTSESDYF